MGEYATYKGESVKIGTCEDMYYLRHDQRHLISGYKFTPGEDRFRFPFPSEDGIEPGHFGDHDKGERIPGGWTLPEDYDHDGSVQFKAEPGYLLSVPCPESKAFEATGLKVGRNGWHGGYQVMQQKEVDGELWIVVACRSCRSKWRLPLSEAAKIAEAFIDEAERTEWRQSSDIERGHYTGNYAHEPVHSADTRREMAEMARRILAGYKVDAAVV